MTATAATAAASPAPDSTAPRALKLLSFNIQAGASVERYRQYVTRSLQHVLPHPSKRRNLGAVAQLAAEYDLVALQEADAGSLRSGFMNQTHFLAESAGFPFWSHQPNRRVGRFAESSNGLLSKLEPSAVLDHRLPGAMNARGALEVRFGGDDGLRLLIAHLALTPRARKPQLDYLADVVDQHPHVVLMGDLNCTHESGELDVLIDKAGMHVPKEPPRTFPSWKPQRAIDHILLSRALEPTEIRTLPLLVSDHLPLAMTVTLPESCRI